MQERRDYRVEITDEEEAEIHAGIAQDPDNPELTEEELASLRPAAEVLPPALYAAMIRSSDERRDAADATVRLDPDVLAHFRATGPDWQARINAALRASMTTPKAG